MDNQRLVTTYRWLDKYGQLRRISIFVGPDPQREVEAYAAADSDRDGDIDAVDAAPVLVARMDESGKFTRLQHEIATRYGLDTAAAWNNLFDLCRSAHGTRF